MPGYLDFLDKTARGLGVPVEEARAIYQLESSSGRNPGTSSAGARGHMQLMPGTAREMGVTNIDDPYQNIQGGLRYYAQQRKAFGDPALAAAAYNAGPGRVRRAGGVPNIGETQSYVRRFRSMLGTKAPTGGTVEDDTETEQTPYVSGGLSAGVGGIDPQALAAWQKRSEDVAAQREALRKQQYAEGQKLIEQAYGGPSAAAKLMSLSQALLSPTPYRGFAGTLHNVTNAMADTQTAVDEASRKRAAALLQLQQSYASSGLDGQEGDLDRQLKLLQLQARQRPTAEWTSNPDGVIFNKRTGFPKPGAGHIELLLKNPNRAREFDIKFGPGAAAEVLAQYGQGAK